MNAAAKEMTASASWDNRLEALAAELKEVRAEQVQVSALLGQAAAEGKAGKQVTHLQTRGEELNTRATTLIAAIEYAREQRLTALAEEADEAREARNRKVEELGRQRAELARRIDRSLEALQRDAQRLHALAGEIRQVSRVKPDAFDPLAQINTMQRFAEQALRTLQPVLPATLHLPWREWDPRSWATAEARNYTTYIEPALEEVSDEAS
jgi:signal transduction histidine kinase